MCTSFVFMICISSRMNIIIYIYIHPLYHDNIIILVQCSSRMQQTSALASDPSPECSAGASSSPARRQRLWLGFAHREMNTSLHLPLSRSSSNLWHQSFNLGITRLAHYTYRLMIINDNYILCRQAQVGQSSTINICNLLFHWRNPSYLVMSVSFRHFRRILPSFC